MPSDIKAAQLVSLTGLPLEGDPSPPSLTHRMLRLAHSSLSGKAPRAELKLNLRKVVPPVPWSKAHPTAANEPFVKGHAGAPRDLCQGSGR